MIINRLPATFIAASILTYPVMPNLSADVPVCYMQTADDRTLNLERLCKDATLIRNVDRIQRFQSNARKLPDGTTFYPDGTSVWFNSTTVYPDGTTVWADGTTVYPNGTVVAPDGSVVPPELPTVMPDQGEIISHP